MLGSGHLRGSLVADPAQEEHVLAGAEKAGRPTALPGSITALAEDKGVLLFAMGDGNHSLATAKSIWEKIKPRSAWITRPVMRWLKSKMSMMRA